MQRNLFFLFIVCALVPHTASSNRQMCYTNYDCGSGQACQDGMYCATSPISCQSCHSTAGSIDIYDEPIILDRSDYGASAIDCCYALCPPQKITEINYVSDIPNVNYKYDFFGCQLPSNNGTYGGRVYRDENWQTVCEYFKIYSVRPPELYCLGDPNNKYFDYDGDHINCNEMLGQANYDGFVNKCHGAHAERVNGEWTCKLNKQEFKNLDKTLGFTVYDPKKDTEEKCITTCPDDTHAEDSKTVLCGVTCKICIPNDLDCNDQNEDYKDVIIPGTKCPNGTISGKITWSDGAYDYSQCKCESNDFVELYIESNNKKETTGTGKFTCTGYDHTKGTWARCNVQYTGCAIGRCSLTNPATLENVSRVICPSAPRGYYNNVSNSWSCIACPLGSTTWESGAESIDECEMRGKFSAESSYNSATQFCDNIGCFYLPDNTHIFYNGEK